MLGSSNLVNIDELADVTARLRQLKGDKRTLYIQERVKLVQDIYIVIRHYGLKSQELRKHFVARK